MACPETDLAPILIVEDDDEMAQTFAGACRELGHAPVIVTDLGAAVAAVEERRFALILLDRMLPGGDGVAALARLRAAGAGQPHILMVSALGRAGDRVEGLERGADDYLPKPFEPEELRARMRALLRRGRAQVSDNDFLVFGDLEIRVKARTVHVGASWVPLSPREFDLLLFFARNAGQAVTRMQLLEHVWNLHFDPQTNVVDVHVGRLRRKLEAPAGRGVIHTERGAGYVFDPARDGAR